MHLLKLYRFPATVFLLVLLLIFIIVNDVVTSRTITLNNQQVTYKTSGGGRWGAFSHDQEILDRSTGKMYIKTYHTFCISNLFASPQKAIKSNKAYLVLPSSQVNKRSDITYYTLTAQPLSAFALFFHILAYFISGYTYLIIPLVLLPAIFKKELSKDYPYAGAFHKGMINAACYALIILVLLFAGY